MFSTVSVQRLASRVLPGLPMVLVSGLGLSACAPGAGLSEIPAYTPSPYELGVGDEIRVQTFGEDQLTGQFRIPADGQIAFPILGDLPAAGMTTRQLAAEISDSMREHKLLRKADISVQVVGYRPVSVIGEVQKPGQFAYQPNMTLLTAVAAAGGFTYRGFQNYAYVIRQEPGGAVVGRLQPQDYVKPEDVIKIYERHF